MDGFRTEELSTKLNSVDALMDINYIYHAQKFLKKVIECLCPMYLLAMMHLQWRKTCWSLTVKFMANLTMTIVYLIIVWAEHVGISPDKARKGVIYPLKTGIYALVGIFWAYIYALNF